MGFSRQEYWSGLPFSPLMDLLLSELSTMTRPSWVAPHGMAHSFIELCKPFWHDNVAVMLGKMEARKRRGWQRIRWLYSITDSMDLSLCRLWEMVKVREAWSATVHGVAKSWTWLSDWMTTKLKRLSLPWTGITRLLQTPGEKKTKQKLQPMTKRIRRELIHFQKEKEELCQVGTVFLFSKLLQD